MNPKIQQLTSEKYKTAVDLLFNLNLDTREEIEHHLNEMDKHWIALTEEEELIGVVGWYHDNVNYANEAMGEEFPGEDAFWVGFFGVKKEYQKQGIGKLLLEKMESEIMVLGAKELWVSSVPESKTYYEEKGFELIKEGEISGNKKFFLKKILM